MLREEKVLLLLLIQCHLLAWCRTTQLVACQALSRNNTQLVPLTNSSPFYFCFLFKTSAFSLSSSEHTETNVLASFIFYR